MTDALAPLDWVVIGLYVAFVIGLAVAVAGRSNTAEDYFLAGRQSTWAIIGLSLFASNISGTTLVGLAGDAYNTGISVYNYEWLAAVILVFFALFILPYVLRAQVYTIPEYLERRYDRRVRLYFSGLTLFLTVFVDTAATLYAGSLLVTMVFPGVDLWVIIAGLAVLAGAYTIVGGLSAVMITDAVQAVILIFGSLLITWFALDLTLEQTGGWTGLMERIEPEKLSLIRPLDDPAMPWLGMLLGAPLLGFYYWCTNQYMVQRLLSAKSTEHGRWGAIFAGFLKLPTLFIMVMPGTLAIILFPDLERGDLVYPTLVFELLPVGLLGLVLVGFLAAMMSQVDSTMNSAATLVTMDFARLINPRLTQSQMVFIGRMTTLVVLVLAILWAPQIQHFDSVFRYLQKILSYAAPQIVALFVIGSFWRGASAGGAMLSLVTTTLLAVLLFGLNEVLWLGPDGRPPIHFLYVAPILFVIAAALLVGASLIWPSPADRDVDAYIWTPADYAQESRALAGRSLFLNYRVHALVLLLLTTVIVVAFR